MKGGRVALVIALGWLVATVGPVVQAGEPRSSVQSDASSASFDHSTWDRLLGAHVDSLGRVAYSDLQRDDMQALRQYTEALAVARPEKWSRDEELAFWINAYNAGLVWAVLQGRSPESSSGREQLFEAWKFRVAGRERSPDEIEHEILRKRFDEPRIHFAIVCASTSCPPLRAEAYTASRLEAQLEEGTHAFLNDPSRNVIDPKTRTLRISSIFDWFRGDFEKAAGSVPTFLARYVDDPEARTWLASGPEKIEHLDYDWTLNAQPGKRPRR